VAPDPLLTTASAGTAAAVEWTPPPERSYMICASPRTGSYLLSEGLAATGLAGRPTEFLSPSFQLYWSERWSPSTYPDYLERVVAAGTTPNGVFGLKVHSSQLSHFLCQATGCARLPLRDQAAVVEDWLPGVRYVWLRRRDRVRQAVSYARALQTHVWWHGEPAPAPYGDPIPGTQRFDFALIERCVESLGWENAGWASYFRANGIDPLELYYEDVAADRPAAVGQVLEYLDLPPDAAARLPASRFQRQADAVSESWTQRYRHLADAKRERALSAFAGIHRGQRAVVLARHPGDGTDPHEDLVGPEGPDDLVTIDACPDGSGARADYALVVAAPGERALEGAAVVLSLARSRVGHPFVVPIAVDRRSVVGVGSAGRLELPDGVDHPVAIAVALAAVMGAGQIEVAGLDSSVRDRVRRSDLRRQLQIVADSLSAAGTSVRLGSRALPAHHIDRGRPVTLVAGAGRG